MSGVGPSDTDLSAAGRRVAVQEVCDARRAVGKRSARRRFDAGCFYRVAFSGRAQLTHHTRQSAARRDWTHQSVQYGRITAKDDAHGGYTVDGEMTRPTASRQPR